MMVLLPKLHINRHTARSIVFGGELYGGLALPNPFITQGIDKLRLFLGHLRIQDRTGQLIHIDMSYLQLLAGCGTLFLNQDENNFKWLETGWLQSLWSFASKYSLKFLYPTGWVPPKPRSYDMFLMDFFQQCKLTVKDMRVLNRCRLYLQVLTVSDIMTADGKAILPAIKTGQLLDDRPSNLLWPTQGRPSPQEWNIWKQHLAHMENKGKLVQPLGKWIASTHQRWRYLSDLTTDIVYDISSTPALQFHPILAERPLRSGYWFDFSNH